MPLGRDKVGFNEVYLDGETLKVKKDDKGDLQ